jgi:pimeloyl-ACP methyl ester carboxylesterase
VCLAAAFASTAFGAQLAPHPTVLLGRDVGAAEVRKASGTWRPASWETLERTSLEPGKYEVRARIEADVSDGAVEVPQCAGRAKVSLDGRGVAAAAGPVVIPIAPGGHEIVLGLEVSGYERRIACGEPLRIGPVAHGVDGLGVLYFASPHARSGGGQAVVYVPAGHDPRRPRPLLVGTHPWNGSMWTYAAYAALLRESQARDVLLLMPSGLGNSLYTADAEDEVLRAIDAVSTVVAVDPRAVSIWGASMGGAGATTIAFHNPDRFASVTSFFGDAKYDLSTYVRSILPDDAAAHAVNAVDVVDNARNLFVWLIHGEDDRTSPIRQSEVLAAAMRQRGFQVRFDRVADAGHSGALVAQRLPEVVAAAAAARTPDPVARVTYRSVRPFDVGAYGVRFERMRAGGDAFVDVERFGDGVHVHSAEAVRAVLLRRGALGTSRESPPAIVVDDPATAAHVGWEPAQ